MKVKVDYIIAGCTTALAGFYIWGAFNIRLPRVGDPLGPRAFPLLIGVALLATVGWLMVETLRTRISAQPAEPAPTRDEATAPPDIKLIAALTIVTALYLAAFQWLGYFLATSIYLSALTLYFHRGSRIVAVLSSVGFSAVTYLMFNRLLGARLPQGVLPF